MPKKNKSKDPRHIADILFDTKQIDITQQAQQELQDESDRGAALVGTVMLEELLDRLIASALVPGASPPGVGNAHARVEWAHALGLLAPGELTELRRVFQIRNTFAHELTGGRFDAPDIAKECEKLSFWDRFYMDHSGWQHIAKLQKRGELTKAEIVLLPRESVLPPEDTTPRQRFVGTVLALLDVLSVRVNPRNVWNPTPPEDLENRAELITMRRATLKASLEAIGHNENLGDAIGGLVSQVSEPMLRVTEFYEACVHHSRKHYEAGGGQPF